MKKTLLSLLVALAALTSTFSAVARSGCTLYATPLRVTILALLPSAFWTVHADESVTYWDGNTPLALQGGDYLYISYDEHVCLSGYTPNMPVILLTFSCNDVPSSTTLTMPMGSSGTQNGGYEATWWISESCLNCTYSAVPAVLVPCSGPPQ